MEEAGIEPATCRMQSDHSTPELHPLFVILLLLQILEYNILQELVEFLYSILGFSY